MPGSPHHWSKKGSPCADCRSTTIDNTSSTASGHCWRIHARQPRFIPSPTQSSSPAGRPPPIDEDAGRSIDEHTVANIRCPPTRVSGASSVLLLVYSR